MAAHTPGQDPPPGVSHSCAPGRPAPYAAAASSCGQRGRGHVCVCVCVCARVCVRVGACLIAMCGAAHVCLHACGFLRGTRTSAPAAGRVRACSNPHLHELWWRLQLRGHQLADGRERGWDAGAHLPQGTCARVRCCWFDAATTRRVQQCWQQLARGAHDPLLLPPPPLNTHTPPPHTRRHLPAAHLRGGQLRLQHLQRLAHSCVGRVRQHCLKRAKGQCDGRGHADPLWQQVAQLGQVVGLGAHHAWCVCVCVCVRVLARHACASHVCSSWQLGGMGRGWVAASHHGGQPHLPGAPTHSRPPPSTTHTHSERRTWPKLLLRHSPASKAGGLCECEGLGLAHAVCAAAVGRRRRCRVHGRHGHAARRCHLKPHMLPL
jgi:hypothetical protein